MVASNIGPNFLVSHSERYSTLGSTVRLCFHGMPHIGLVQSFQVPTEPVTAVLWVFRAQHTYSGQESTQVMTWQRQSSVSLYSYIPT